VISDFDKFDKEVYISCDIEANGPYPLEYSMLNFGASSFKLTNSNPLEPISTFSVNIKPLEGAKQHPKTMEFWAKHQDIWEIITRDPEEPEIAMKKFVEWVEKQPGKPAFVEYPGSWDFIFIYTYLIKFVGRSPFSFRSLGIATMAFTMLQMPFRGTVKRKMPKGWFLGGFKHNHTGLSDSIGQGQMFMRMLAENLGIELNE